MCFKEPQELTKGRKAKQNKGTKGTRQLKESRGTQVCPEMELATLRFPRNLGTHNLGQKVSKTTCPKLPKACQGPRAKEQDA